MKAICATYLIAVLCGAAAEPDYAVDYAESTFMNKKYRCVLMKSHLKETPPWDAKKSPLPMTARKAVALALSSIEIRLGRHPRWPDSPGWRLPKTALIQIHDSDVWYYRISLTPKVPGSNWNAPVEVFVTFDGKVVSLDGRK